MTVPSIEDSSWDPTEPTLPELMEDWSTWAQMLGAEHALDRLVVVCLELREKYDGVFQIQPGSFMAGIPQALPPAAKFPFLHVMSMCDAISKHFRPLDAMYGLQGLEYPVNWQGTGNLLVPAPGYDPMGLPHLDIRGQEVYVVLIGRKPNEAARTYIKVKIFTVQQVPWDADICPICQRDLEHLKRASEKNPGKYANTIKNRIQTVRFDSDHHNSGGCDFRRGHMMVDSDVEFHLYGDHGAPWTTTDVEGARRVVQAWCVRTPGLVHLPSTHGEKYMVERYEPIRGEVLALLRVHTILGRVPDADVIPILMNDPIMAQESERGWKKTRDKITLATVKRWRKALGLPEVKG
jgi:hypothetical protein